MNAKVIFLSISMLVSSGYLLAQCNQAINTEHFWGSDDGSEAADLMLGLRKLGNGNNAICLENFKFITRYDFDNGTTYFKNRSHAWGSWHTWTKGSAEGDLDMARLGGSLTENIFILYDATSTDQKIKFNSNGVSFLNGGKFGIGTTSPSGKLHVDGDASANDVSATGGGGYLVLGNTTGLNLALDNNEIMARSAGGIGNLGIQADGGSISIHSGLGDPASKIQITEAGRLGLGITNPSAPLHLKQASDNGLRFQRDDGTHDTYEIRLAGSTGLQVWNATDNQTVMVFDNEGKVGIGTSSIPSEYQLAVDGKMIAEELKIQISGNWNWPDYVFEKQYPLLSIKELEQSIRQNGHLPGLPSAAEVEKNGGVEVGDMQRRLLEKVEELTLYIIQLEQRISELEDRK